MNTLTLCVAIAVTALLLGASAVAQEPDPRLREVTYDPHAVVTIPVQRGVVTLVMLEPDEAILEVASGLGADCAKPESTWCVSAQAGGRSIFVKAKSGATAPDTLAVVTDRRTHSFRFEVIGPGDSQDPVYRLVVKAPSRHTLAAATRPAAQPSSLALPTIEAPSAARLVAGRLQAAPQVINSKYSMAEGTASEDIVPTLVFDDGRFTYLRFPGNREIPAVFHVLGDGSETLVNSRMEGDLLVVDRVSRRLMLRAGTAVVGLWNDHFDLDGIPPNTGTTVPGVERIVKADTPAALRSAANRKGAP